MVKQKRLTKIAAEILFVIPCFGICIISKFLKKGRSVDVGLGPLPLINNVYHSKALRQAGYSAETFVRKIFFITNDFDFNLIKWRDNKLLKPLAPYYLFFDRNGVFLKSLINSSQNQGKEASSGVIDMLIKESVKTVVAGNFGDKMTGQLKANKIEYHIRAGIAKDILETIIQNRRGKENVQK